jgi:hypothetical protein
MVKRANVSPHTRRDVFLSSLFFPCAQHFFHNSVDCQHSQMMTIIISITRMTLVMKREWVRLVHLYAAAQRVVACVAAWDRLKTRLKSVQLTANYKNRYFICAFIRNRFRRLFAKDNKYAVYSINLRPPQPLCTVADRSPSFSLLLLYMFVCASFNSFRHGDERE